MSLNPILVEVTRGPVVESFHRGRIAVVDGDGHMVAAIGDVDGLIYPRSSVKALQAIALLETGAAKSFGLTRAEIALCCASHNAEQPHLDGAQSILQKSGVDETALECGCQPPRRESDLAALHRSSKPPLPIHNNCSGKHAGFIALARYLGVDPAGYVRPDHPVQQTVEAVLEEMLGTTNSADLCGIDGCSVPTYAIPLSKLADGFSRFVTGREMTAKRADICRQLYEACVREPFMVAGTERFCTDIMQLFAGRVFVKTGAEGVFTAGLRDSGLAVALKCDDGATRASQAIMAAVIAALLPMSGDEKQAFRRHLQPVLKNWRQTDVGEIRAVGSVFQQLRDLRALA